MLRANTNKVNQQPCIHSLHWLTKAIDSIKLDRLWNFLVTTSIKKIYNRLVKLTTTQQHQSKLTLVYLNLSVFSKDWNKTMYFQQLCFAQSLHLPSERQNKIVEQAFLYLTYADGIAVTNHSQKELQLFLCCLVKYSSEIGLDIKLGKTECMTKAKDTALELFINGKQIT